MIHHEIMNSGLANVFDMSDQTDNAELKVFLGKVVRYVSPDVAKEGTQARDFDFIIRETQLNYEGKEILRGYAINRQTGEQTDTWGRPINPKDVVMVEQL